MVLIAIAPVLVLYSFLNAWFGKYVIAPIVGFRWSWESSDLDGRRRNCSERRGDAGPWMFQGGGWERNQGEGQRKTKAGARNG